MSWLIGERFVNGKSNGWGEFAEVTLTQRGMAVLNQVPHSIAGKADAAAQKPLGVLMREAAVSHSVGLAAGLIQSMLQSR